MDILEDVSLLRKFVSLLLRNTERPDERKSSFLEDMFGDDRLDGCGDDEVVKCVQI